MPPVLFPCHQTHKFNKLDKVIKCQSSELNCTALESNITFFYSVIKIFIIDIPHASNYLRMYNYSLKQQHEIDYNQDRYNKIIVSTQLEQAILCIHLNPMLGYAYNQHLEFSYQLEISETVGSAEMLLSININD